VMGDGLPVHLIFAVRESAIGLLASFRQLERISAFPPLQTYRSRAKHLVLSASGQRF
jgi:hypothetical protein